MSGRLRTSEPDERYRRSVDRRLSMLFWGFDKALMPTLRGKIDYDGLLKAYEKKEEKPEECAMYTGALLMGKLIESLSLRARGQALYALQNKDASSRFFLGYNTMLQVANGFNVLEETKDLLVYQIIGTLRGLNQDQIANLRHQFSKSASSY